MLRKARFVLVSTLLVIAFAAPATAGEECIEVPPIQFKHCL